MINAADFACTIGYEGSTAIVDSKARAQYGKLRPAELAQRGLWRAAFASALHSGDKTVMDDFIKAWNSAAKTSFTSVDEFSRLFGVKVETVKRVSAL
ncbi:MAG TPA: hypothetical protein PLC54_00090 [Spirochaetales bacterium]|nr:hypothetical protein [Spirochaetales bacterium]